MMIQMARKSQALLAGAALTFLATPLIAGDEDKGSEVLAAAKTYVACIKEAGAAGVEKNVGKGISSYIDQSCRAPKETLATQLGKFSINKTEVATSVQKIRKAAFKAVAIGLISAGVNIELRKDGVGQ